MNARHTLWGIALLALSGGCVRSAEPALYTLSARPGASPASSAWVVEVRRPHIAGYLDRREIVRQVRGSRLDVAEDALWAEPLDALIGRVLAADLALRLPKSKVFSDLSGLSADPDARIELTIERFEQTETGEVELTALVGLRIDSAREKTELQAVRLTVPSASGHTAGLVSSLNELVAQLADRIARMLDAAGARATTKASP